MIGDKMPAISVYFDQRNYDNLLGIRESTNKKMSEVVNWMVRLGNARRLELQSREEETLERRMKTGGIDNL